MAAWSAEERHRLAPIVEALIDGLEPLAGRRILVLCSAGGDVAFRVAQRGAEVVGLELDDRLLATARRRRGGLAVRFEKAHRTRIPYPDSTFDGLASEFIVYPTSRATDIGQPEMARVLRRGGVMAVTDVIVPTRPPREVRAALAAAGLDYLCVATPDDFRRWTKEAGLVDVEVRDLTDVVRPVWEARLAGHGQDAAAALLLDAGPWALGRGLRYVEVSGRRPG